MVYCRKVYSCSHIDTMMAGSTNIAYLDIIFWSSKYASSQIEGQTSLIWGGKVHFLTMISTEIISGSVAFKPVQTGSQKTGACWTLRLNNGSSSFQPLNLWPDFGQVHIGSGLNLSSGLDGSSTRRNWINTQTNKWGLTAIAAVAELNKIKKTAADLTDVDNTLENYTKKLCVDAAALGNSSQQFILFFFCTYNVDHDHFSCSSAAFNWSIHLCHLMCHLTR